MRKTHSEVLSFVQFYNFHPKFVHHFSDLTTPLTDLLRKSKLAIIVGWCPASKGAIETLRLRWISAPCRTITHVDIDVMFTVAREVSNVGLAAVLLHD